MARTIVKKITTVGDGIGVLFPKWTQEADGFRKGQLVRVTIEPVDSADHQEAVKDGCYWILPQNLAFLLSRREVASAAF